MRAEFGIVREAVLALHDAGRRWLAGGRGAGSGGIRAAESDTFLIHLWFHATDAVSPQRRHYRWTKPE